MRFRTDRASHDDDAASSLCPISHLEVMVLGVFMLANVALMLSVKFGCYSD